MISRHFSKDHCILISKSEIRTHILQPWSTAVPQNTTETKVIDYFFVLF